MRFGGVDRRAAQRREIDAHRHVERKREAVVVHRFDGKRFRERIEQTTADGRPLVGDERREGQRRPLEPDERPWIGAQPHERRLERRRRLLEFPFAHPQNREKGICFAGLVLAQTVDERKGRRRSGVRFDRGGKGELRQIARRLGLPPPQLARARVVARAVVPLQRAAALLLLRRRRIHGRRERTVPPVEVRPRGVDRRP